MANGVVIVWVSLLLFAPSMAWSLFRPTSVAVHAGGSALTLAVLAGVTTIAGRRGVGSVTPLRWCAVVLAVVLFGTVVAYAVRLVRRARRPRFSVESLAIPVGMGAGIFVLIPPFVALRQQGLTFGLITLFNADLANYALIAENTAAAGFVNTNHVANADLGVFSRDWAYVGATALINFISGATGLSAFQATLAAMGVAVCLLACALWAVAKAVWPGANWSAAAAVLVACLCSLSCYTYGQFFLGGVLGVASVATALAGATLLAGGRGSAGFLAVAAGGALGVYSYPHLALPALLMVPVWSVVAALLSARTRRPEVLLTAGLSVGAVVAALLVSSISLGNALTLIKAQSHAVAGWTMPVLTSQAVLVWPVGIGHHSSLSTVIVSWAIVLAIAVLALGYAWRRGSRVSVRVGAVVLIASLLVVLGAVRYYGPDRYQAWKMEAFLLPIAIAVLLPAVSAVSVNGIRVGRATLAAASGAVLVVPFALWEPTLEHPPAVVMTPNALVRLADAPEMANVASLNIRLPGLFETMAAGAIIRRSAVVFSSLSYYPPLAALHTCTLTRREMLVPGETNAIDLGGGYVLLERPSKCEIRK